ncbi:MAG: squalene/phytoene synthase family protein [Gemmatimonadota bacterium]|nr:squalene/phytoene synthase family protein [Gemmatimonadota bacterium]
MTAGYAAAATRLARSELAAAYDRLFPDTSHQARFDGQLLRPLLSIAGASDATRSDDRFWYATLAVQLAHEASLVHDDVVDNASTRRGRPTTVAARGPGAAVLEGDLLLTAAYVAASATGSHAFISRFATAVSRTVRAERSQGACMGRKVERNSYEEIALGKSGELMGCALGAGSMIASLGADRPDGADGTHDEHCELGRRIGLLYQMMDDFLDYCPAAQTGKPPLGDYAQGRWTWPLDHLPDASLGLPMDDVLASLHSCARSTDSGSAMMRAAQDLSALIASATDMCATCLPGDNLVIELLGDWRERVTGALEQEQTARASASRVALAARFTDVDAHAGAMGYLAHHSRSFRFASRLLPRDTGLKIARVYAFCRFTDNLADEPARAGVSRSELVTEWVTMAATSYDGTPVRIPVLDLTMLEMREAGVPFSLVDDLCRGMHMDIDGKTYATLHDLRLYTYRVAGVVGLWVAQLSGVRDASALANAERMGHAMQLTNILRDVGEDWRNGRLYLPLDVLARHGLVPSDIGDMVSGARPVSDAYREMTCELVALARADYRAAFAWLPSLPDTLQPGMAVAAELYEAIHDALRRNDYDNIHNRAATPFARKVGIAGHALRSLRRARKANAAMHPSSVDPTVMDHGWQT